MRGETMPEELEIATMAFVLALSRKWWYILVTVLFHWLVRWQGYDV